MLFPSLKGKTFGYVNLDLLAQKWLAMHPQTDGAKNPLLDPSITLSMVEDFHRHTGVTYSYGGWLENRSTLWRGSYLDDGNKYFHLGVDINAPEGTPIASDVRGTVVRIDDDHPEEYGWGPRVIVRLADEPIALIYGHLDPDIVCHEGDVLEPGKVFARVGPSSHNGGWFPHTHIQAMTAPMFEQFMRDPSSIDGYAYEKDLEQVAASFPDPIKFFRME